MDEEDKPTGPEDGIIDVLAGSLRAEPGAAGEVDDGVDVLEKRETIARLKACAARLGRPHVFSPGQLVQWKKGLKNRRTPAYGEPIVVIQILDPPVFDPQEEDAGSPCFREPLTLVAGEIYLGDQFLCFYYDARRFEPYEE